MADRLHAIVGDGITALAFLETCLGQGFRHVTVIGRNASQLGRGIAYAKGAEGAPWRYAYLLNSPADDIDPEFAAWLERRWDKIAETMAGRQPDWLSAAQPLVAAGDIYGVNAPREFYGDYMEARARDVIKSFSAEGTKVTLLNDVVVGLSQGTDMITLSTQTGQQLDVHSADIAPGGPDTMRFEGDDGPFSAPSVFGYEDRIAEHITAGAEIFCIGGNAAMLDVLRLCQSLIPDERLKFAFCAPEGEIPPPLVPRLPRKQTVPSLTQGHETAESFLSEIRREIEAAEAAGDERREIRAGFRSYFLETPLDQFIADTSEASKVSKVLRFWLRGGTRDTIFDMRRLVGAGAVRILKGRVLRVEATSTGAAIHIQDHDGSVSVEPTGFVVNCAGAGPGSTFEPLSADRISRELIGVA
ncbi:MAG: FAD/NAD(P)-binding protein, partial [Litoreibacter sp.]|nr:FAD/NAD(P)-binding protein [Litoreibacter sp.]